MKKLSIILFLMMPQVALAADKIIKENRQDGSIMEFLKRIKGILMNITGALVALFIIIAGIKYITAAGNATRLEDAKKTLTYAIYGLVFYLLTAVVFAILTGSEFTSLFK